MLIDQRSRQTVTAEPGAVAFPEKCELEDFPDTNFPGMYTHFRQDATRSRLLQSGPGVPRFVWERNRLIEQHRHLSLVSSGNQD